MRKNSQRIARPVMPAVGQVKLPTSLQVATAQSLQPPVSALFDAWGSTGSLTSTGQDAGGSAKHASVLERSNETLVEHLPMVRYVARRIHERLPQHIEMEDLVSAGVLGLIDAFEKFDSTKNVQFRSYAQFRVRGAILDSLRVLDWSPRELRRKGRAVEEAIRFLTHDLHRSPTEPEIAEKLSMSLDEYQQMLGELRGLEIGTLHVEHSEDSGEEELAYIPGRPEDDPLFCCMRSEMREKLARAIEALPERERTVISLYYHEEMTMREIGLALGVVESRVSQIHSSAVLRLRAALRGLPERKRGGCHRPRSREANPDLASRAISLC